ncbi:MAG: D-alanyl-D-alanine carboxypeptidase/D-alanyl-D-alanine-endopeptidase [Acidobacteriales bacterium]|nr:D-alanyl-D-alanine carboxypeptidase/D-alanyl-D-alanine-endopeptidase [Terriglobales bacterium]
MRPARAALIHLLAVFLILSLASAAESAAAKKAKALEKKIDAILTDPDLGRAFWGISVVSLKDGKTLYARNPDKLFAPASNTKLFTTAAALAVLGPDYKFRTTVETAAPIDKYGRIAGDVVLIGRGDPNLSGITLPFANKIERKLTPVRVLEDLADQLVQRGVRYIDGDIVADDTFFPFERYGEGWAHDDLTWDYGAPISALSINDNVMFLNILPAERVGDKAFVNADPFVPSYRIENRVMTTPPGTGPRRLAITRDPGSTKVLLSGTIPVDDLGDSFALAIEDPAEFAADLFRSILEKRGVRIYGVSRARHAEKVNVPTIVVTSRASHGGGSSSESAVPTLTFTAPTMLASYESLTLAEDLRLINKVSQNLHSEIALRLLGREKGTAGTAEAGLEVLHGVMTQAGIGPDEYVFYDGSGLSRKNLVTAAAVTKLLTYADAQPWSAKYLDTLPKAGTDGSLAERFKGGAAEGRVMAKTGSLSHVNALSGYLTTMKGERLAFSILVNNHNVNAHRSIEAIDRMVEALVDDTTPKKK